MFNVFAMVGILTFINFNDFKRLDFKKILKRARTTCLLAAAVDTLPSA